MRDRLVSGTMCLVFFIPQTLFLFTPQNIIETHCKCACGSVESLHGAGELVLFETDI